MTSSDEKMKKEEEYHFVVIGLPSNTIRDSLDVHHPDFLETNAIVYNALRLAAKTGNVNVLDTLFRHVYRWPRDDVQNALDALGAGTYNVDKTALPVRIRERLGLIKRVPGAQNSVVSRAT
jgi:hypothetical protein